DRHRPGHRFFELGEAAIGGREHEAPLGGDRNVVHLAAGEVGSGGEELDLRLDRRRGGCPREQQEREGEEAQSWFQGRTSRIISWLPKATPSQPMVPSQTRARGSLR